MVKKLVALALAMGISGIGAAQAPPDAPLAERFAKPPAAGRILKIVHGLPDAPEQQDGLFDTLARQGFGGMVLNLSFQNYLEDEAKWQAFTRGVNEAKRRGFSLWLYDERGYPSGAAGGITLRDHPEWEARGLLLTEAESHGGAVTLDVPPGRLVRAVAFPIENGALRIDAAQDLAQAVQNGKLTWEAPAGAWRVMAITEDRLYENTHAALSLADKLPYVNLLIPEATQRFLDVTHTQYAAHLTGDPAHGDLGQYFVATFTDEPSLMGVWFNRQAYRVLPWAPNLPVEFAKRRGYALDPVIPALVAEAGAQGKRARYDFWLTVGELVSENFFGQIQTWCRAHNTQSGGHLLCEENLLCDVPFYGDFFRCIRRLDAPSIDCLTSVPEHVPWHIARLLSSAAELEERRDTMSETSDHSQRYRPKGDERPVRVVTEDEIRGTCNRQLMNGITTITSYYSFANLQDEQLVRLNEWIGRCSTMLAGGRQVCDVAFVYPCESIWPNFVPAHRWGEDVPEGAQRIERIYGTSLRALFANQRDFTFIDSRTLTEGRAAEGALRFKKLGWRAVVLPAVDTLPIAAWNRLAEFWRAGGVVIALAVLPANSESEFPSPAVAKLAEEMFGAGPGPRVNANTAGGAGVFLPEGSDDLLPTILDGLLAREVRITPPDAPIRFTHRRIDDHDVFFLINDSASAWAGEVAFAATGAGEQWDPATGAMTPVATPDRVALSLAPYGGALFRFTEVATPKRFNATSGELPGIKVSALPASEPKAGHGEFVKAEITPAPAEAQALGSPAWRANGQITRSQVDTFLFASFDYAQPVDMRGACSVTFTTAVPDGQKTPARLLVILRDAKGAECIGEAGRPLGTPGVASSFVALDSLSRAGWSPKEAGEIDLGAIQTIRIGWGGYLGTEGEQITFSFTAPGLVSRAQ